LVTKLGVVAHKFVPGVIAIAEEAVYPPEKVSDKRGQRPPDFDAVKEQKNLRSPSGYER